MKRTKGKEIGEMIFQVPRRSSEHRSSSDLNSSSARKRSRLLGNDPEDTEGDPGESKGRIVECAPKRNTCVERSSWTVSKFVEWILRSSIRETIARSTFYTVLRSQRLRWCLSGLECEREWERESDRRDIRELSRILTRIRPHTSVKLIL